MMMELVLLAAGRGALGGLEEAQEGEGQGGAGVAEAGAKAPSDALLESRRCQLKSKYLLRIRMKIMEKKTETARLMLSKILRR